MDKNRYFLKLIFFILISFSAKSEDLLEVLKIALDNNYDYKAQVEKYNSTISLYESGKAYLYPSVDLQAGYNIIKGTYDSGSSSRSLDDKPLQYSLRLTQPLFNVNAFNQYSKANLLIEQSRLSLDRDKNNLFLYVVQYYFEVLSAMDDLELAKAQKNSLLKQMDQISQQIKVGKSRAIDIEEIKSKYLQVEAKEVSAEHNLAVKQNQLNNYLNYEVASYKKIKDKMEDIKLDNSNVDHWINLAMTNNLDILMGTINVEALQQDVDIANSQYYPNVSLIADFSNKSGTSDSINQTDYTSKSSSIGVVFNMNLFQGGSTYDQSKSASFNKKNAEYLLQSLRNNISVKVRQYYLNVYDGFMQINGLTQSVVSAEKFLNAAERSYNVGLKTTTDVLIANESYYNAKKLLSQAKYAFIISALSLKSVVGPLSVEDIEKANKFLE